MKFILLILLIVSTLNADTFDYCCRCTESKNGDSTLAGIISGSVKNRGCTSNKYYTKLDDNFYRHERSKNPKTQKIIEQFKKMHEKSKNKKSTRLNLEPIHIRMSRPEYWITSKQKCDLVIKTFIKGSRAKPKITFKTCEQLYQAAIKE
jgi:hypothetical protein